MDKSKAQSKSVDAGHLKAARSHLAKILRTAGMHATAKPKKTGKR